MPAIPFGDNTALGQALSTQTDAGGPGTDRLAQVTAPTLLQKISSIGAGTPLGGGSGIGGMNFGSIGSGIQDFFQAAGAGAEARNYGEAATLATEEAEFTKESTAVQNAQATRQVMMTVGAQKAGVAATGFTQSGSALSILRSSAQQAALGHQMITMQGGINEEAYNKQAAAYMNMKHAATNAQRGDILGGILKVGLGLFGL